MPSYVPPEKNSSFVFYVSLVSQSNTKTFQANPTLAAGDVKVAVDDAAPANLATLPVVDADFTKRVKVSLSASEMNGDRVTVIFSDASGAEWCDLTIDIATVTKQIDDLATQTSVDTVDDFLDTEIADIQSRLPAALVSGRIDASVGAMAADVVTSSALNANAVTEIQSGLATQASVDDLPTNAELSTALAAADDATLAAIAALNNLSAAQVNAEVDTALADYDAPTKAELDAAVALLATAANLATVDTVVDAIKVVTDALTSAGAAKLALSAGTIVAASAVTGTLSTTQMTTDLTEATNDHFNGRIIIWTSGALLYQATDITDYDGATKMLTYTAITEAPSNGDSFIIV